MKPGSNNRRAFLTAGVGAAIGTLAAPAVVKAQSDLNWRMVTSWPRNSPGPGWTAQRLADKITRMSGGRLTVTLHAAGEMVPPLEVFDAVGLGTAEMAHTASLFWSGKAPAAALFTAGPFGLTAVEHHAWIYHGGGQALWDRLYEPFGIKPLMAGNTGMQMGGWFKKEIKSLADLAGLKQRIPGLGGAILEKLGGTPLTLPPGEIFAALQSGLVDGAEFLGPWSDSAFGFYKVAPYYYWPGYHEPNGTGEFLINAERFAALPENLQEIVATACAAENSISLAESEWHNAEALKKLVEDRGVTLRAWPEDVLTAARKASSEVLDDLSATDALSGEIVASFRAARDQAVSWGRIGYESFYKARGAA